MSIIVRSYMALTGVSRWIERLRIALLVRIWGIEQDCEPPVPWREREKLPEHNDWPMEKGKMGQSVHPVFLTGAVKVGPVRPVPAKFDEEKHV